MSVSSIPAMFNNNRPKEETDTGPSSKNNTYNRSSSKLSRAVQQNVEDLKSVELWRACLAELLGTFVLTMFVIGMGVHREGDHHSPLIQGALGCGFIVTVLITSLTKVSGGHINPAISIGFLVAGEITVVRFVFYSVFQCIGAVLGSVAIQALVPSSSSGFVGADLVILPAKDIELHQAVGMEAFITAVLLYNTLSFVDQGRDDVRGSIPYMVGLTVTVNILIAARISGSAMNPALALGPAIVNGNMKHQWIYWVGPLLGACIGALLYDNVFSTKPLAVIGRAMERTKRRKDRVRDHCIDGSEGNGEGQGEDDGMVLGDSKLI